jgi:hypothetical protein
MQNEQSDWWYRGKKITPEDIPEEAVGFCYRITDWGPDFPLGKIYIGKKSLSSSRRVRMSAKEKATLATRKVFKIVKKDSDWQNYNSSCIPLKQAIIERPKDFKKEILQFAFSKKNLTYLELRQQFLDRVLETDSYNLNIFAKFFKPDVDYNEYLKYKNKQNE